MRGFGPGPVGALLGCGLLAACSVASEGGGTVTPPPPPIAEFQALEDEQLAIQESLQGEDFTDPSTLPVTGEASYEGVAAFQILTDDPIEFRGDLTMAVDFGAASDPISGTITDIASTTQTYSGDLAISNSTIDRTAVPDNPDEAEFTYGADLGGTIVGDVDGDFWDLDGDLNGDFLGEGAEFAVAPMGGEACQGFDCVGFVGGLDAVRQ